MVRKVAIKKDDSEKINSQVESGEEMVTASTETQSQEDVQAELEKSKIEAAENYDKFLRISAELENYKKRAARDKADAINYGTERLIKDILPIIDSLERALDHASGAADFDAFVEGLQLIYEKLCSTLEKHGVERLEAVGKDFDPNYHEAMLQVSSEEYDDNKVVEEFERGYLLNGRLIRPVKVSVSKKITNEE
jgi:molecular chaperone GrpE